MKTILEVLNLTADFLKQKGFSSPKRQAQELLSRALSMKVMDLYLYFDRPLTEKELSRCRQWLIRRAAYEPIPYIEGIVEFLSCEISVSPAVLIPRPETEILADKIVRQLSGRHLEGKVLWDLCTGSGCLGIAIKKQLPELSVVLSDISSAAVKVAESNAKRNAVVVECKEGDLMQPFRGEAADFVVCNPPYISEGEYAELDRDVRDFEPRLALVGGIVGAEFYERLAVSLPQFLKPQGQVWLEIGASQGELVQAAFSSPFWKKKTLEKDWAGWDRFYSLES